MRVGYQVRTIACRRLGPGIVSGMVLSATAVLSGCAGVGQWGGIAGTSTSSETEATTSLASADSTGSGIGAGNGEASPPKPAKPVARKTPPPRRSTAEVQKLYVSCFKSAYKEHGFGDAMDRMYGACLKRHGLERKIPKV